jgi:ankyrin repeat protein
MPDHDANKTSLRPKAYPVTDLLAAACRSENIDMVKEVLAKRPEDWATMESSSWRNALNQGLRFACGHGNTELASLLLDHGADVHCSNDDPLCAATFNGHAKTTKMLLDRGARIDAQRNHALRWSTKNGHLETVKLLLERGADPNYKNGYALSWAQESKDKKIVEILLEYFKSSDLKTMLENKGNESLPIPYAQIELELKKRMTQSLRKRETRLEI